MFQSAELIGRSTDDESLYNYSTNLLLLYIKEELIFLPNSMRKTDIFIPLVLSSEGIAPQDKVSP